MYYMKKVSVLKFIPKLKIMGIEAVKSSFMTILIASLIATYKLQWLKKKLLLYP